MQLREAVVLDTNVVSYIHDGDPRATFYEAAIREYELSISFQTMEEIIHGAYRKGWGARRMNGLHKHLEGYTVVYPSRSLVLICAELRANQLRIGRPLSPLTRGSSLPRWLWIARWHHTMAGSLVCRT